jgi:hypothetical protein
VELAIINHNGNVTVAAGDQVETLSIERDARLAGRAIRVSDAAEKYNTPHQTLSDWAERGLIRIIRQAPRLLELDEADVKLATQLYGEITARTSPQRAGRILNSLLL